MKPPIPADVDLQDFAFMPLDVARLWDSDLAMTASGEAFRGAVLLWCKAWHQIPAGSLPNNDLTLMKFAGCDASTWQRIKADAMHGFILCDDGRFYHPVVCEKAIQAWHERERYRKAANKRWKNKKKLKDPSHMPCIEDACKTHMQETGTEIEKENIQKKDIPAKGTHLSPEWQPSSEDKTYAADRGFNAGQINNMVADFVEHFTNGKGRTQTRPEWSRSWQRWVRQDIEWHGPPETRKARPVEEEPLTPEEIAALERARKGNGGLKAVVPPAAPFAEYNALADELPDFLRRT